MPDGTTYDAVTGTHIAPYLDPTPPSVPEPVQGVQTYEEAILASAPVVYYRLDEPAPMAAGSTVTNIGTGGSDWDGTVANTLTFGAPSAYASLGTAVNSTGANGGYIWSGTTSTTDDYGFDFDYSDILDNLTSASLEFWIKIQPGVSGGEMADGMINWGDLDLIDAGPDSQIGTNAGYTSHAWSGPINDGEWHYVLLTYDATVHQVWVYVDGDPAPRAQGDLTTNPYYNAGGSLLNWFNRLDDGLNAEYDEIAIYDRVLTGDEGAEHYRAAGNYDPPANFTGGTILQVNTTDVEGHTVTDVEFFANGESIGAATENPPASGTWELEWLNVPQGDYIVTAEATDDGGGGAVPIAVGTSAALSISVGTAVNIEATLDAQEPNNDGYFTVTRSNVDFGNDLLVLLLVDGTAEANDDYTLIPGAVTILAGTSQTLVPVEVIDDGIVEGDETVVVSILPSADYIQGTTPSATLTIKPGATVSAVATDDIAMENPNTNTGEYTITRDGILDDPLVVHISMAGGALGGVDYNLSGPTWELDGPMTVTIPAGVESATVTLTAVNDAVTEGNLSARLMIASASGYNPYDDFYNDTSATVIIYEDDWDGDGSLRSFWRFEEGGGFTTADSSAYGNHMWLPPYVTWEDDGLQGSAIRVTDPPAYATVASSTKHADIDSFTNSKEIVLFESAGNAAASYPAGKQIYVTGATNAGNNGWFTTSANAVYSSTTHNVLDIIDPTTVVLEGAQGDVTSDYPPGAWIELANSALGGNNRWWMVQASVWDGVNTVLQLQPQGYDHLTTEPNSPATTMTGKTYIFTNENTTNETDSPATLSAIYTFAASAGDVTADWPAGNYIESHLIVDASYDAATTTTTVAVTGGRLATNNSSFTMYRYPQADDFGGGWTPVEMTIDWRVKVYTDYRYYSRCKDGSEGAFCGAGSGRLGHYADVMRLGTRTFTTLGWWNFMEKGKWEHYAWTYKHLGLTDTRFGWCEFYRNGQLVYEGGSPWPSPPWAFINLCGDASYGEFRLYDRALLPEEIAGLSDPGVLDGDPGLRWLSPAPGMYGVGADLTLSVALTGKGNGVSRVVFKVNGITLGDAAQTLPGTWTYDWDNIPAGGYAITAEATHYGDKVTVSEPLYISTGADIFVTTIDAQSAESDADTNPGVFRIENRGAATDVTFVMDGGDGVTAGDFTISSTATLTPAGAGWSVNVPGGGGFVDIVLNPVQDGDDTEEDEVVTLSLTGPAGVIGSPATAAVNLADYDPWLRALWRFDEQDGPIAYDRSGFGNDATLMSGKGKPWSEADPWPKWIVDVNPADPTDVKHGLLFDYIDDYVTAPGVAGWDPINDSGGCYTVAFWMYFTGRQVWSNWIGADEDMNNHWWFTHYSYTNVRSTSWSLWPVTMPGREWHHYVYANDNGTATMYVDGEFVKTNSQAVGGGAWPGWQIGRDLHIEVKEFIAPHTVVLADGVDVTYTFDNKNDVFHITGAANPENNGWQKALMYMAVRDLIAPDTIVLEAHHGNLTKYFCPNTDFGLTGCTNSLNNHTGDNGYTVLSSAFVNNRTVITLTPARVIDGDEYETGAKVLFSRGTHNRPFDGTNTVMATLQAGIVNEVCAPGTVFASDCSTILGMIGETRLYNMCLDAGQVEALQTAHIFEEMNNTPPTIAMTSPAEDIYVAGGGGVYTFEGSTILSATTSDNGAVMNVVYRANGEDIGRAVCAGSGVWELEWDAVPGRYWLTGVATDNRGLTTESTPPVEVVVIPNGRAMISVFSTVVAGGDPNAAEADPVGDTGIFYIYRDGRMDSSFDVDVSYTGSATYDGDYSVSHPLIVHFDAWQTEAMVTVTAIDDADYDPGEDVRIAISPNPNIVVGYGAGTAVIDIIDDEIFFRPELIIATGDPFWEGGAADPLPVATEGISYTLVLETMSGLGPYEYTLVDPGTGPLPDGLTLSSDGVNRDSRGRHGRGGGRARHHLQLHGPRGRYEFEHRAHRREGLRTHRQPAGRHLPDGFSPAGDGGRGLHGFGRFRGAAGGRGHRAGRDDLLDRVRDAPSGALHERALCAGQRPGDHPRRDRDRLPLGLLLPGRPHPEHRLGEPA